jgi:hypothetical protein
LRNRESLHAAGEAGHGGLLRIEPIIDPFLRLLKEAMFSFGFCCEGINCSSHNESPKPPGVGVFNSSSCAPVKSGGTLPYCESDGVPAILLRFCHSSPTLSQGQREKQDLRPRVRVGVDRFQSTGADVGINFGCDDARVAEQSLNHSQISTVLQHVGCRTVPEGHAG